MRDAIAVHMMQGLLAADAKWETPLASTARQAVDAADALIAELRSREEPPAPEADEPLPHSPAATEAWVKRPA